MKRRTFFKQIALASTTMTSLPLNMLSAAEAPRETVGNVAAKSDAALRRDWLARWGDKAQSYVKLGKIFLANHNPDGWGGLSATPWFLSLSRS